MYGNRLISLTYSRVGARVGDYHLGMKCGEMWLNAKFPLEAEGCGYYIGYFARRGHVW